MLVRAPILAAMAAAVLGLLPASAHAASMPANPAPVRQTSFEGCRTILAKPNSVLYIGDSITAGWFDNITATFNASGHPVCINARPGRTTAEALQALKRYQSGRLITKNTTLIMAVGANDTWDKPRAGYMRWQVDNVERVVGLGTKVVWVDVLNWTANQGAARQRAFGQNTWTVNLELWAKAHQYPNLKIAGWNAAIRGTHTRYTFDHLHTTSYGNTFRQNLVLRAL